MHERSRLLSKCQYFSDYEQRKLRSKIQTLKTNPHELSYHGGHLERPGQRADVSGIPAEVGLDVGLGHGRRGRRGGGMSVGGLEVHFLYRFSSVLRFFLFQFPLIFIIRRRWTRSFLSCKPHLLVTYARNRRKQKKEGGGAGRKVNNCLSKNTSWMEDQENREQTTNRLMLWDTRTDRPYRRTCVRMSVQMAKVGILNH